MALEDALGRLYALAKHGARHGIEPMRAACARDGDPQDRLVTVHVGGTNGKGSVAASLEAVARAGGLRTGLYTSPHLVRFAERIRIDGAPIDDVALEHYLSSTLDRHPELTFFEVATLAAFHAFHDAGLDLVNLEVGLGGRLDATNVVSRPRATAITTVAYDHTEHLGDTIEAIAGEKAGILKASAPVVTGRLPRAAAAIVEARARDVGAGPVWRVGDEISAASHGEHLVVQGPGGRSISVTPSLRGAHQRDNAAVTIALSWLLRAPPAGSAPLPIEDVAIARGLAQTHWPGRLEEIAVADGPLGGVWLLDGAHNEEGARALAAELDARAREPRALVFGAMADKAWGTMLRELAPRFDARVYVAPTLSGVRRETTSPEALAALDPDGVVAHELEAALVQARRAIGPHGLVVVAGSLYLVGETRARLLGADRDPQVGL